MGYIKNTDPCLLFDNCSSHFNEEGYKILAQVAYDYLLERKLLVKTGIQKPGKENTAEQ